MMSDLKLIYCFAAGVPNLAMVESVDDEKVNTCSSFSYIYNFDVIWTQLKQWIFMVAFCWLFRSSFRYLST